MKKLSIALIISVLGFAGVMTEAQAYDTVGLSINLGGPAYYHPSPVYAAPSQAYYTAPPVAYYRPAPGYDNSSAFSRYDMEPRRHYGHPDNGFNHGGHGHHSH